MLQHVPPDRTVWTAITTASLKTTNTATMASVSAAGGRSRDVSASLVVVLY